MDPYSSSTGPNANVAFGSPLNLSWQRLHRDSMTPNAPYLLTLSGLYEHGGSFPQARAVVDDFGSLQIVRGWL